MIEFHAVQTPNAMKVSIMLKELNLPYELIDYDIPAGDHLAPKFRKLNPNNRLPVIRDMDSKDGDGPVTVFESGAILIYLAEKSGQLLSHDLRVRTLTQQWLMWQMAAFGPMSGQLGHFLRHCPQDEPYSVKRYADEVERLLDVLEYRLVEAEFLAGDYSIADIAVWPVAVALSFLGVNVTSRSASNRWLTAIATRNTVPEVTKATLEAIALRADYKAKEDLTREQWSNIFGHKYLAAARPRSQVRPK